MAERLLLDTHALIWAAQAPHKLGQAARTALEASENEVFVSAVSAMEIATKYRLGKLAQGRRFAEDFMAAATAQGFLPLPISVEHGQRGGNLAIPHKDPFDRLLIAQAQIEQMRLVSNERKFDTFGVLRLW